MRFAEAAPDARHAVYAAIQSDPLVGRAAELLADASPLQLLLARAAMNGERTGVEPWRAMFPGLFGSGSAARDGTERARSDAILAVSLEVADKGEQARAQFRGAIVEALTERLIARRGGPVRRERRVLFDGIPSEIHPYDVTLETPGSPEAYDCKWGARGIGADVLHQLDDARRHAAEEGERLTVALVVFDAALSCAVRLARQKAPSAGIRLVTLGTLHELPLGSPPGRGGR